MGKYTAKNFRISKDGLGRILGSLEREVMEALWALGSATGKEVLEEITRKRKVAKTTVFTVLERLVKKGLVRKTRGESVYLFEPLLSERELAGEVSKEVLKGVFDLWSTSTMASFVDLVAEEDPEELERLSRLISSKKKELSGGEAG